MRSWVVTVVAMNTAVQAPAATDPPPSALTCSGTTGSSRVKLPKESTVVAISRRNARLSTSSARSDEAEDGRRERQQAREGRGDGRWVLLDYLDIVVHVQHAEERAFYDLERLWKDCPVIEFVDRDAPAAAE